MEQYVPTYFQELVIFKTFQEATEAYNTRDFDKLYEEFGESEEEQ